MDDPQREKHDFHMALEVSAETWSRVLSLLENQSVERGRFG